VLKRKTGRLNIYFAFFIVFFSLTGFKGIASEVEVNVEPAQPIFNESFNVIFKIHSNKNADPYITFDPGGIEVIGKRNNGMSIRTTIINGQITTVRENQVIYEMVATRPGTYYLKNILVEVGGEKLSVPRKTIKILKKAREAKKMFVRAELSKKRVYLGEGIDARYYLYFRVEASFPELKEFPRLNGFIKRFREIKQKNAETVEVDGVLYNRILVYDVRLFPEKEGRFKVDPIKLLVRYAARGNQTGLSGWGFQLQSQRTRTLVSPVEYLEVIPLPLKNAPASYAGLVGEHQFSLDFSRTKYLVNEAVEFKMTVTGTGALETFGAPVILEDDNLEQFDIKEDFSEISRNKASKVFDYTLIARGPLDFSNKFLKMSYFDPDTETFVEKKIEIPPLKISGSRGASESVKENEKIKTSRNETKSVEKEEKIKFDKPKYLVAPIFKQEDVFGGLNGVRYLCGLILLIVVGILFEWKFKIKNNSRKRENVGILIKKLKKDGLTYNNLYELFEGLENRDGLTMSEVVRKSKLTLESKNYFLELLDNVEKTFYGNPTETKKSLVFKKKPFDELRRELIR